MGRKGGCKVVPRNFLSHSSLIALVKHYNVSHLLRSLIQISITTSLPLSPTSPPFLPPSPSSVSHPHPPRAQPNPCTHSPPPLPPQNFLIHTPTFRTPPSISSHLIPSHPIPSIPRPSYILVQPTTHLISYLSISYTPTQLYIYAPTPSHLLIHPASSRFSVLSSRISHARVPGRVHWLGALSAWCVLRGLGGLGVVHRCGKGRGEEGGVGVCMVKNGR